MPSRSTAPCSHLGGAARCGSWVPTSRGGPEPVLPFSASLLHLSDAGEICKGTQVCRFHGGERDLTWKSPQLIDGGVFCF